MRLSILLASMPPLFAACVSSPSAGTHADHSAGHPGAHHAGAESGDPHHHDFSDVDRFAAIFDAPDRDAWQRPDEVVSLLSITQGMTVADLGTGTGYFLARLSAAVGERGQVVALDVEPAMIEHVRQRAERENLPNVQARAVSASDPGLAAASVDRILIVDTWHHLADRRAYAAKLRQALRPGGAVLVVDFTLDSPHGPPASMRVPPETVREELEAAGLRAEIVAGEELPMQYVVRGAR